MRSFSHRCQRTLGHAAEVTGLGFLTGAMVRLRFLPAPPGTGIVFVRTDLRPEAQIKAKASQVTGTQRRTTLGTAPAQVTLVEHVLAALAGLRIDNCYVELNAPEPPGLDGSARSFCEALLRAGAVQQPARRPIWGVDSPVVVHGQGCTLALHPTSRDELQITYFLDYGLGSPIGRQTHTEVITPESFANQIAGCRTFLLKAEADEMRRQGIGAKTTTADLLVIGPQGPLDNHYRFADELARHKILDLVGDLSLAGYDLRGHVVAYRSGHPLNIELASLLSKQVSEAKKVRQAA